MKKTVAGVEEDVLEVVEVLGMVVEDIGSEDDGRCYLWVVGFLLVPA